MLGLRARTVRAAVRERGPRSEAGPRPRRILARWSSTASGGGGGALAVGADLPDLRRLRGAGEADHVAEVHPLVLPHEVAVAGGETTVIQHGEDLATLTDQRRRHVVAVRRCVLADERPGDVVPEPLAHGLLL